MFFVPRGRLFADAAVAGRAVCYTGVMEPLKIMLCAGEVSGDMYGAALIAGLRKRFPGRELDVRGMGGDAMAAAGAALLYHTDALGAMGITEVIRKLGFFRKVMRDMAALAERWRPDVLVTVDYYSFNVALAERVKALGIRTVQYVSPKIWVWRRSRIYRMAKAFDRVLCIFPFEPELYEPAGLPAEYVGHPLTEQAEATRAEPPPALPWGEGTRIALLPGSRAGEILSILPTFLDAACRIERTRRAPCTFMIPTPTKRMRALVEEVLAREAKPASLTVVDGQARHVMAQAQAALIASGTATLEACLMGCPAVLAYRVSVVTELLARLIVRGGLRFAGLVNIVLGRPAMTELLQRRFTVHNTASALLPYLRDTPQRRRLLADYADCRGRLGDGATARAAESVARLLEG